MIAINHGQTEGGGWRYSVNEVRSAGVQERRSARLKSDKCIFRTTSSQD